MNKIYLETDDFRNLIVYLNDEGFSVSMKINMDWGYCYLEFNNDDEDGNRSYNIIYEWCQDNCGNYIFDCGLIPELV